MLINRQNRVRVAPAELEQFLARVNRFLHLPRASATVCLVSDAQIAKWNRAYRRKPKPTDVLSFPAASQDSRHGGSRGKRIHSGEFFGTPANGNYLGDIAIAPAFARRNARRAGRALDDELRVLILHGMLHLLGYDHETDDGEMARLELRLRRRLGIG